MLIRMYFNFLKANYEGKSGEETMYEIVSLLNAGIELLMTSAPTRNPDMALMARINVTLRHECPVMNVNITLSRKWKTRFWLII